jgi:predicted ATP-binding protein involved in virulence
MKIRKISTDNFRCFDRLELELSNRVNLLIGDNGSGKTAILDALAIGLGAIATHLPEVSGVLFRKYDLREADGKKMPYTRVYLESFDDIRWDATQSRDKSLKTKKQIPRRSVGTKQLVSVLNAQILDRYNNAEDFELPLFTYYGVSRAILDIPLSRKGFQKKSSRFEALSGALKAESRFRSAFIWFYNKENQEHRFQKERKSFDVTLKELDVVRRAITAMFPDISEPHIEVNPLRFMVKKHGQPLALHQLSDGYKTMLGLIIDLCARYAMANPHLPDPLESEGIVMIDEVDLHLHPTWQQRVIGDLVKTFPNTQFILTTHSPFVLESLNNHLKREKIKDLEIDQEEIRNIMPFSRDMVKAFVLENSEVTGILDEQSGLIDDRLLHVFNDINMLYDKMRDIEWESKND